jgi:hypothetical protein
MRHVLYGGALRLLARYADRPSAAFVVAEARGSMQLPRWTAALGREGGGGNGID